MRHVAIASLIVGMLVTNEAFADDTALGARISGCFHPTGRFVSASISGGKGSINFKGGFSGTPYRMTFSLERKSDGGRNMVRVTPIDDDAPFPPNPKCSLRNWSED
jgi:hypothetical protein